jgi:1-deoxy-D-xylulose-5-phosphate synthase
MRFAKPLDEALLHQIMGKYGKIMTVEDGCLMGGFGSAVLEFMADHGYQNQVKRLGIPDKIFEHGSQLELHREAGFDPEGIRKAVRDMISISRPVAVLRH